jgi:methylornithine synthase
MVKAVKAETGLAVMVSPGLLDGQGLALIEKAGADWYALYQETHNHALFERAEAGAELRRTAGRKNTCRRYGPFN